MSSFFSTEVFAPGTEVQVNRFNPEEIFQYTTYSKVKPLFPVPQIRKRYMLVTNDQVVDMTGHSFKVSLATVTDVHAMPDLLKVKYKNGEVISLTFAGDKIQQYGMKETERCLQYIRLKMSENGVKANVVTNRYKKNIATAQGLLDTIRELEAEFADDPSYDLVVTVMEVLRDAVELFGEANDSRYLRALDQIQVFLQRPDVISILDTMAPPKREGSEDTVESSGHSDVPSAAPSIHISQRLSKRVGEMLSKSPHCSPSARSAVSPSEEASLSSPSSAMSAPVMINMPPVASAEDTAGETMRRKLTSGSATEGTRPRVQSKARRRSMRTQSLENAQFLTMDSLHFDDAEDALWVEDEDVGRGGSDDIESAYDIVDDENIALLDSMIGNMTHELEGIIGESVDLEDMPESPLGHRRNGSNEIGLGFTLTRGLSSLDVNEDL